MPGPLLLARALLLLVLLGAGSSAAEDADIGRLPPGLVTASQLEARIAETEWDHGLEAEARERLIGLYRRALSNLREAENNRARAERFAQSIRTAPEQTQRIQIQAAAVLASTTPDDLAVDKSGAAA